MAAPCTNYQKLVKENCRLELYEFDCDGNKITQKLDVGLTQDLQVLCVNDCQLFFIFPPDTKLTLQYKESLQVCEIDQDGVETPVAITSIQELQTWIKDCRAQCSAEQVTLPEEAEQLDLEPICYDNGTEVVTGWVYAFQDETTGTIQFIYFDSSLQEIPEPTVVSCPEEPQIEVQEIGCFLFNGERYIKYAIFDENDLTADPVTFFLSELSNTLLPTLDPSAEPCDTSCNPAFSGYIFNSTDLATTPIVTNPGMAFDSLDVFNASCCCAFTVTMTGPDFNGNRTFYLLPGQGTSLDISCLNIEEISIDYLDSNCQVAPEDAITLNLLKSN